LTDIVRLGVKMSEVETYYCDVSVVDILSKIENVESLRELLLQRASRFGIGAQSRL
jgi:hypothetical protein